jgi:hypothetical protein
MKNRYTKKNSTTRTTRKIVVLAPLCWVDLAAAAAIRKLIVETIGMFVVRALPGTSGHQTSA